MRQAAAQVRGIGVFAFRGLKDERAARLMCAGDLPVSGKPRPGRSRIETILDVLPVRTAVVGPGPVI